MRIRIDAAPGELEARAEDAARAVRRLGEKSCCGGHGALEKAVRKLPEDRGPRNLDLPALQGGVDKAAGAVERIRRRMLADMLGVIKGAE